jgi:hypothetical protein
MLEHVEKEIPSAQLIIANLRASVRRKKQNEPQS